MCGCGHSRSRPLCCLLVLLCDSTIASFRFSLTLAPYAQTYSCRANTKQFPLGPIPSQNLLARSDHVQGMTARSLHYGASEARTQVTDGVLGWDSRALLPLPILFVLTVSRVFARLDKRCFCTYFKNLPNCNVIRLRIFGISLEKNVT